LEQSKSAYRYRIGSGDVLHIMVWGHSGLNSPTEANVRRGYALLRELRETAAQQLAIPANKLELSMGMSHDLEWAIAEGATIVRVGTAVFGPRLSVARG